MYISAAKRIWLFEGIHLKARRGNPSRDEYSLVKLASGNFPVIGAINSLRDHLIAATLVMPFGVFMTLGKYEIRRNANIENLSTNLTFSLTHLGVNAVFVLIDIAMKTITQESTATLLPNPSHITCGRSGR
jgi:hypothetical protein